MREDEDRRVERRVGAPPALPLRVLVPSRETELSGTHAHPVRSQKVVRMCHEEMTRFRR